MNVGRIGDTAALAPGKAPSADGAGGGGFASVLESARAGVDLDAIFEAAARRYGVSVSLLKAVAKAESNFNPGATSRCGAMGIMQLMPGTAAALGVKDPYDPEQNIMAGAMYLRQLLDRFDGDIRLAVAAYNAGPGSVLKYGGVPPYEETQSYVERVMGYLGLDMKAGTVAGGEGVSVREGRVSALGELLEGALLSGLLSEGGAAGLPISFAGAGEDISGALIAAVLQMQLEGGDGDGERPSIP